MIQTSLSRRALGGLTAAAGVFGILRHPRGEVALKIRCSLDTAPSHVRNISIVDYLSKLQDATGGRITNEVFHSGQLFSDLNVGEALLQGQVDMAAPGAWTLTGLVPDCDFCQLPVFYGQKIQVTERASDGEAGAYVAAQIQGKLRVMIIGPWIDLGFQNWYATSKPLNSPQDLKGLKLRSPGGAGIGWRIGFFGGIANTTASPNMRLALSEGTFDGFVSTNESCATAKLWEAGVKYSYQDNQYVAQYVPMIAAAFWAKLTPDEQALMFLLWADNIGTYRMQAAAGQDHAREAMAAAGVVFTDPSPDLLASTRRAMQADVGTLIRAAKLSPEVVRLAETAGNGGA